ncbi:MAG: FAD-dependent oxidoreductase, partial [Actinomycetota bacterium]|nr:FAD-dependent oxidoreductase [Actinomycetota bacterium]
MKTYAIVGDGAAGTTAAFYIRRHDPEGRIAIYSEESTPAYYRAALTNYLMGELRAEQLFAVPPNFYNEFNVGRVLTRVVGVDSKQGRLQLSNGESHPYDELLIATGSRARPPTFAGAEIPGVMTMRTMQDARFIMDLVQSGHLGKAVVVGGGILGLELVAGLRSRGVEVTYVIRGDHFMPNVLDRIASDIVLTRCRHFGVDIRTDEEIGEAYANNQGYLWGARLANSGETLETQLMIVAIGITPNVEFLQGSGIEVDRGVPVDERMRTNVSNVYAGGDVAQVMDRITKRRVTIGLWEPSRHHGRTAGINMAGGSETWRLSAQYTATRLYDLDLAALGRTLEGSSDETVVDFPEAGRRIVYRKLVFEGDRLVGALLLGERREKVRLRARLLRKLIDNEVDVSSVKEALLDPLFDINAWMDSLRAPEAPEPRPSRRAKTDVSRIMGRPA